MLRPDVLASLLLQLVCYVGSLFEPFDSLLPQHGLLRSLVNTVKDAKRAYNVKHGIPSIDDQQFFDEDDDEDEADEASSDVGAAESDEAPADSGEASSRGEQDGRGAGEGEDIYS